MGNPRCGIAVLRYLPSSFSFSASPSTLFIKHSPPSHPSPVSPSFVFFVLFVCAFVIVILDRPETAICWYPDLLDLLDLLYWNAPRYQIVNVVSHANDDSLHSIFNIRCWCRWFGDASMCSFSSFLFFSVVFPFSSLPTCVFVCFHPESWVVPSVWISVVYKLSQPRYIDMNASQWRVPIPCFRFLLPLFLIFLIHVVPLVPPFFVIYSCCSFLM